MRTEGEIFSFLFLSFPSRHSHFVVSPRGRGPRLSREKEERGSSRMEASTAHLSFSLSWPPKERREKKAPAWRLLLFLSTSERPTLFASFFFSFLKPRPKAKNVDQPTRRGPARGPPAAHGAQGGPARGETGGEDGTLEEEERETRRTRRARKNRCPRRLRRSLSLSLTTSSLPLDYVAVRNTVHSLTTELQIERPVLGQARRSEEERRRRSVIAIKPFARPGARSCRRRGDRERRCHRGPRGGVLRALRREW